MLTMGLGKDIVGNPVVADLAKMPHVLVAGTTGSGKSVGINAMILSLLYKAEARDVRLLMIDPKMLEMSVYEGIPHLLAPVVTDMRQAAQRPELVRRRDGAALQADEQARRAQPGRLQQQDRRGRRARRVHLQPVQPDARSARAAGAAAAHRRGDRRTGRPDDGGRQEDRGADRAPGAEGARRRHPPDPGHAAAERRRDHRPDQGQHPDAHRASRFAARSTAAPSSTRWAPRRCSGMGDMLYMPPRHRACRCACTAPSSATRKCTAWSRTCKQPGRAELHRGVLEGGVVDGEADPAARSRAAPAAARTTRCTTRRSRSC